MEEMQKLDISIEHSNYGNLESKTTAYNMN